MSTMNNPSNPFPDEKVSAQPAEGYPTMDPLPLKPVPQQYPVQSPPASENIVQPAQPGSESVESAQIGQEEALTIRLAIGKLNDYLQWFLLVLELALLMEFFLMLIGASTNNPFTGFTYALTVIPLYPFNGIVPSTKLGTGGASIEWSTLIAMAVYFVVFYAVRRFLHIVITSPEEPVQ
jgi:hypothetical protein